MESQTNFQPPAPRQSLKLSLDYRLIIIVLLLVITGMLVAWKPWSKTPQLSDRTLTVTGEATLKSEPDEYVFSPSYEFVNVDKQSALDALTTKSNEIVAKLKNLGVTNSQIKSNSSGNTIGGPIYYDYVLNPDKSSTYTLQLTITLDSLSVSQKVQDYLTTTSPTGSVSPQANFSEAKQKSLQSQARDEATKDARAKADQSAKNLGFKVGAVKSVTDGSGFGGIEPLGVNSDLKAGTNIAAPSLTIQPGENSLSYSVTVVYFLH